MKKEFNVRWLSGHIVQGISLKIANTETTGKSFLMINAFADPVLLAVKTCKSGLWT